MSGFGRCFPTDTLDDKLIQLLGELEVPAHTIIESSKHATARECTRVMEVDFRLAARCTIYGSA